MSPRLRLSVLLLLLLLFAGRTVQAQQAVVTSPAPGTTAGGNASSTIATLNVFQRVFAAAGASQGEPARRGCTIQNNDVNNMWVTEGIGAAGSTKAAAVVVAPGGVYTCTIWGVVLTGEIDITGTATGAFYAAQY